MGNRNKLLMDYKGKSLIEHAVDTLLGSEVSNVIVVLGFEAEEVRAKVGRKPVRLVLNPDYRDGMSSSIKAGVGALPPETDAIMIYLADQPLMTPAEVNQIVAAFQTAMFSGKTIVVPFHKGQRGNPVVMDASFKDAILDVAGDVGCRKVIKRNPDRVFALEMETDHVVRDIDRMEDYAALGL